MSTKTTLRPAPKAHTGGGKKGGKKPKAPAGNDGGPKKPACVNCEKLRTKLRLMRAHALRLQEVRGKAHKALLGHELKWMAIQAAVDSVQCPNLAGLGEMLDLDGFPRAGRIISILAAQMKSMPLTSENACAIDPGEPGAMLSLADTDELLDLTFPDEPETTTTINATVPGNTSGPVGRE
jgi:hypothetical protein